VLQGLLEHQERQVLLERQEKRALQGQLEILAHQELQVQPVLQEEQV